MMGGRGKIRQRMLLFVLALSLLAPAMPEVRASESSPELASDAVEVVATDKEDSGGGADGELPVSTPGHAIPNPKEEEEFDEQEGFGQEGEFEEEEDISAMLEEGIVPYEAGEFTLTPDAITKAMMDMKGEYPEGRKWTNDDTYIWEIAKGTGVPVIGGGCVGFAYILSDAAFGKDKWAPRSLTIDEFEFENIRPGDILRVAGGTHSVIVLKKNDQSVVIAEGNYEDDSNRIGHVHWGRILTKAEVMSAVNVITRYPRGYTTPDDPEAKKEIENKAIAGSNLRWKLVGKRDVSYTLTISGNGDMPDLGTPPWNSYMQWIDRIVIEDGVESIGADAFKDSVAYSASIPGSVKTIGNNAFRNCKNLTSVTLEGVVALGDSAFMSCTNLRGVTLPGSIKSVGDAAFADCLELEFVTFLSNEARVEFKDNVFLKCWRLRSVTMPQKSNAITVGMFTKCSSLSSLIIPDEAEIIGDKAFSSCGQLKYVFIPEGVTTIYESAFIDCASLQKIHFAGSEAEWQAIRKIEIVGGGLSGKTIVYNSPRPSQDLDFDEDPGSTPPQDPGSSSNSSSSHSSYDSGSDSSSYSEPVNSVCTISKTGCGGRVSQTTATPPASTQGAAAGCTLEVAAVGEMIRQAAANQSASIVIAPAINGGVTRTEVAIPAMAFGEMAQKTSASLTVSTPVADVTIPNSGLSGLSGEGNVTIATAREGNQVALAITGGGQPVAQVKGGVTLTVPVEKTTPGTVAVLIQPDGTRQVIRKSVAGEKEIKIPLGGSAKVEIVENAKTFSDVPEGWAADAASFVSGRELFNGTMPGAAEGTFHPDALMTRGMVAMALHNLEGNPAQAFAGGFSDVGQGSWCAEAAAWTAGQGLMGDSGNGTFGADEGISREQLLVVLWKYAGKPAPKYQEMLYRDAARVSEDAMDAMRWAVEKGILKGRDGCLEPQGTVTRAEVAQMLKIFLEQS